MSLPEPHDTSVPEQEQTASHLSSPTEQVGAIAAGDVKELGGASEPAAEEARDEQQKEHPPPSSATTTTTGSSATPDKADLTTSPSVQASIGSSSLSVLSTLSGDDATVPSDPPSQPTDDISVTSTPTPATDAPPVSSDPPSLPSTAVNMTTTASAHPTPTTSPAPPSTRPSTPAQSVPTPAKKFSSINVNKKFFEKSVHSASSSSASGPNGSSTGKLGTLTGSSLCESLGFPLADELMRIAWSGAARFEGKSIGDGPSSSHIHIFGTHSQMSLSAFPFDT